MNICKTTTAAVAIFTVCTLLTGFGASAQDAAKKSFEFDDTKAGEITFERPVLNLNAAVNPFGDLQLSLLSVSPDEFEELQELIAKESPSSSEPQLNASRVQNYQLTKSQVKDLDKRVKPLVKDGQVRAFHAYRIARNDADFLFGQLPVAGGESGEQALGELSKVLLAEYQIKPSDVLRIESAPKLRIPRAPIAVGESLMVQVNRTTPDAKDETSTLGQLIDGKYIVGTDGYLDFGPQYGKVQVAGQPVARVQLRVETHLRRTLKNSQVVVSVPNPQMQIKGQHLVRPDGTIGLGTYGDVFVDGMTQLQAKDAIERYLLQHLHDPHVSVDVCKTHSVDSDRGGAGFVASLRFETDRARNGHRMLAGQFRLKDAQEEPTDVEFTVKPQEGAESPISQMIAIPAGDRVWLLTLAAKPPQQEESKSVYQVQGRFIEFSDKAMAELKANISVDSTSSAAWVISATDSSALHAVATAEIKAGSARLLSRPQMIGIAGQSMQIQIGSEVPISIPDQDKSNAVELKPIGISLSVTLSTVTATSDRLDWEFGNTNRDGDWSVVTRNISGASILQAGESLVIPLATQNDGKHLLAMLEVSKISSSQRYSKTNESENQDHQFTAFVKKFSKLMQSRKYAEARLIGAKAVELQPDSPAAILMYEKAKLMQQIAWIDANKQGRSTKDNNSVQPVVSKSSETRGVEASPKLGSAETAGAAELLIVSASGSGGKTWQVGASNTVRCEVGQSVRLEHTCRIKQVAEFDSGVLRVEPAVGDPRRLDVYSLAEGGTQIRIVDEHDAEYLLNVLSLEFSDLSIYLKRLFPDLELEVWPIKGAVLLRGTVASDIQRQQIIQVAEQFYPTILNQLVLGANPAASMSQTDRRRFTEDNQASQSVVKVTAGSSSLIIPHNCTRTLVLPSRIRSVSDFSLDQVKVEAVSGAADRISICGLKQGATKLTVIDENARQYFIDIVVEDSVHELSLLARRLYPDLELSFHSVKGAILVRGAVDSDAQCQQIIDVAQQFSHNVLNHTHITSDLVTASQANAAGEQLDLTSAAGNIQIVRSDIKALHNDVRELIAILKARSTPNNRSDSAVNFSEQNFRRVSKSDSTNVQQSSPFKQVTGESMKFFPSTGANANRLQAAFTRPSSPPTKASVLFVCDQPGMHADYLELVSRVFRESGFSEPVLYSSGPYFSENHDVKQTPCVLVLGTNNRGSKLVGQATANELRKFLLNLPQQNASTSKPVFGFPAAPGSFYSGGSNEVPKPQ